MRHINLRSRRCALRNACALATSNLVDASAFLTESLERRIVLSGAYVLPTDPLANSAIDATQEQRIRDGLSGLVSWIDSAAATQSLATNLDFIRSAKTGEVAIETMELLAAPAEKVQASLVDKINNYFDVVDPSTPTTAELVSHLATLPGFTAVRGGIGGLGVSELRLDLTLSTTTTVLSNFYPEVDDEVLSFDANVTGNLTSTVALGLTLGLNLDPQLGADESFFTRDIALDVSLNTHLSNISQSVSVGFLSAGSSNASINADVNVRLNATNVDADAYGQVTLAELNGYDVADVAEQTILTDTVSATIPVTASVGSFTFTGAPSVTVSGNTLGSGTNTTNNGAFAELKQFQNLDSGTVYSGLQQLSGWFSNLSNSSVLGAAAPFAGDLTLGTAGNLGDAIDSKLVSQLATGDVANFVSAQSLATLIQLVTTVNPAISYDASLNRVSYTITLPRHTFLDKTKTLTNNLSAGPLGNIETTSTVNTHVYTDCRFTLFLDVSNGISFSNIVDRLGVRDVVIDTTIATTGTALAGTGRFGFTQFSFDGASTSSSSTYTLRLANSGRRRKTPSTGSYLGDLVTGLADGTTLPATVTSTGTPTLTMPSVSIVGNYFSTVGAAITTTVSDVAGGVANAVASGSGTLAAMGTTTFDSFQSALVRGVTTANLILESPVGFTSNLLVAAGRGLERFGSNIATQVLSSAIQQARSTVETVTGDIATLQSVGSIIADGLVDVGANIVGSAITVGVNTATHTIDVGLSMGTSLVGAAEDYALDLATYADYAGGAVVGLTGVDQLSTDGEPLLFDMSSVYDLDIGMDMDLVDLAPVIYDTSRLDLKIYTDTQNLDETGSADGYGVTMSGGRVTVAQDVNAPNPAAPATKAATLPAHAGGYTESVLATTVPSTTQTGKVKVDFAMAPAGGGAALPRFTMLVNNIGTFTGNTSFPSTPDFTTLTNNQNLSNNVSGLVGGLDNIFDGMSFGLIDQVLSLPFPLIGEQLQQITNAFDDLKTSVVGAINGAASFSAANVEIALNGVFGNPNVTMTLTNGGGGIVVDVRYDVVIHKLIHLVNVSLDTNLGIPALNAKLTGGFNVDITYDIPLSFGISTTDGPYLVTSAPNELFFRVDASVAAALSGKIGFLSVDTTASGLNAALQFTVDLKDPNNNGKLTADELDDLLDSRINGGDLSTLLSAKVDDTLPSGVNFDITIEAKPIDWLPAIAVDVVVNWPFNNTDARGSRPTVKLQDARIMVGGFFANTFGPVIESLQQVLEPVQPVIDVLETQITILEDMGFGQVTIEDLAKAYATNSDSDFLLAVLQVADWITFINGINVGSTLTVHLGDIDFNRSDVDLMAALPDDFDIGELTALADNLNLNALGDLATVTPGFSGELEVTSGFKNGELAFPILDNPLSVFEVLLGLRDDVPLVTYDLPLLKVHGGVNATFPIFPALPIFVVDFIGQINLDAHIAIGLDTKGLVDFIDSDDPEDLLQCFYISDRENPDGTGKDTAEFSVSAELGAYLGFDLSLLGEAKVGGGITIDLAADLNDPNNDGKLRMGELHCLNEALGFSGSGAVEFKAFARELFLKQELPLARIELFDFKIPPADCVLGSDITAHLADTVMVGPDKVLMLDIGTRASLRDTLPGEINERFTVSESGGLIIVEAFGKKQTFSAAGIKRIEADAYTGADEIVIDPTVSSTIDVSLAGGDGRDSLIASGFGGKTTLTGGNADDYLALGNNNSSALGGNGDDTIAGGDDDDTILGEAGNDSVSAGLGNDSVIGGSGNDTVLGGDGNDTIQLSDGKDIAYGEIGDDSIEGGANNDCLFGGDGNDTLKGLADDDTLLGEAGIDSLLGGLGADSLNGGADGDTLNGNDDNDTLDGDTGNDSLSDTLGSNEFEGGDNNDTITAGAGDDTIFGGLNQDTINAGGGNDSIAGEDGNDSIDAGAGIDTIDAGTGNDSVVAGDDNDCVVGGTGLDTIVGGLGNDSIDGNEGADSLLGSDGEDSIRGQDGADSIYGESGKDTVLGGANADLIYGGTENDSANGGNGNDTVYGEDGNDSLEGAADDDLVYGANGNDSLRGGKGRDLLYGGFGFDTIRGQEGIDLLVGWDDDDSLTGDGDDDILYAGRGFDTASGGSGNDRIFGERGDDKLYGDEDNDHIQGGDGNDAIAGGTENDTLLGQDGNDIVIGGAGKDLIDAGGAGTIADSATNVLDGGDDDDHIIGSDTGTSLGDVITGGKGNDLIEALGGPDIVDAGLGNDTVYAGAGGDSILGNEGNDCLSGEAGGDTIRGQIGDDRIDGGTGTDSLSGGDGNDYINAFIGQAETLAGDNGDDYLIGSPDGFDNIDAGDGNDRVDAQAGNDTIFGQAGDDTLEGGDGDDYIEGGAGRDVLLGGKNHDSLYGHSFSGAGDDNKVDILWGDLGDDNTTLVGAGRDILSGNGGNDLMFGEGQNDSIVSSGSDLIDYGNGVTVPEAYTTPVATAAPATSTATPPSRVTLDLNGGTTPPARWSPMGGVDARTGISPFDGADPSIINFGGNLVAAWSSMSSGNYEVYVAQFDRTNSVWAEFYAGTATAGGVSNSVTQSTQPTLSSYADNRGTNTLLLAWTETATNGARNIVVTQYTSGTFALVDALDMPGQDGHSHSPKLAKTLDGFRVFYLNDSGLLQQIRSARYLNDTVLAGAGDWIGPGTNLNVEPLASVNAFDVASGGYHQVLAYSAGIEPYRRVSIHVAIDGNFSFATQLYQTSALTDDSSAPTVAALAQFNQEHFTFFAAWQSQNDHESQVRGIYYDSDYPGVPTVNEFRPKFFADAAVRTGATSVSDTLEYASRPKLQTGNFVAYLFWQHDGVLDSDARASLYHMQGIGAGNFEERIASDASGAGIAQADGSFAALDAEIGSDKVVSWGDATTNGNAHVARDQQFFAITATAVASDPNSIQTILNGIVPTQGVILVEAGTYNGFTIPSGKIATIRPKNSGDVVIINGNITINASGVTLEGLTINGGIILGAVSNVTIRNNTINAVAVDGIDLTTNSSIGLTIIDNTIASTGAKGVDLGFTAGGEIARNTIVAGTRGIDINAAFTGDIERNDIVGGTVGVRWAATARLFDNDIHNSPTGIQVLTGTATDGLGATGPNRSNRVWGNTTGINMTASIAVVQRQHVYANTTGVSGSGTLGGTTPAFGNVIEDNTTGVAMNNGIVRFNWIRENDVGVIAGTGLSVVNNLLTDNTTSDIRISGASGVVIRSNTIVSNAAASVSVFSSGAHSLRGNIIENGSGFAYDMGSLATPGSIISDYNTLHTDGANLVRIIATTYSGIESWRIAAGSHDTHSAGVTTNNRSWSRPQFVHAGTGDYTLRPLTAGLRSSGSPLRNADPSLNGGTAFNQGAFGLTALDTAVSNPELVLDSPLDGINLAVGQTVTISWRSLGFTGGTIKIDLYQPTASGPQFVSTIAAAAPNTGAFTYTSTTAITGAIIHIARVGDAATFDRSLDDTSGPVIGYTTLFTNDNTPTLAGTVNDPAASVLVTVGGVNYTATNNGNGTWTLSGTLLPALADGTYDITVTSTDASGNATIRLFEAGLTIDTVAPVVGFASLNTNDNRPALSGTVDDALATVIVRVNGVNYPAASSGGVWTIADNVITALPDGTYNVRVFAQDAAGNLTDRTFAAALRVDATAPTITVTPLVTRDNTPDITVSVNDPQASVVFTFNGTVYTATHAVGNLFRVLGSALLAPLADGAYTLTVQATDAFGNVSTVDIPAAITVDTVAPTATVTARLTNDSTPSLTGTVNDPTANVVVRINGIAFNATNNGNGTWTLADNVVTPALADGVYGVSVDASDSAGNVSSSVFSDALTIDATRPTATSTVFRFEWFQEVQIDFSEALIGFVNGDAVIRNTLTNAVVPQAQYTFSKSGTSGRWRFLAPLADGNYRITIAAANASDAAGNTFAADVTFDFFSLAGDANRDRHVDFGDLLILAQNYGKIGRSFSQGNFNYSADGRVGFDDLLLLAQNYGSSLLGASPTSASAKRSRGWPLID